MAKFTCLLLYAMSFTLMRSSKEAKENKPTKRLLLKNDIDLAQEVLTLKSQMQNALTAISKLQSTSSGGVGTTYVRWGSKTCPVNTSELVYSGYAAGAWFNNYDGAANYLCLVPDPIWDDFDPAADSHATGIYGTEYEIWEQSSTIFHTSLANEDVPCAVCRSPRTSSLMLPGRNECYNGWTLEYHGYLVAGYPGEHSAAEYICLDRKPELLTGGHRGTDGRLMSLVEAKCGALQCPPYIENRELTCAVCTK